jgi:hypothetical protein
MTRLDLASDHQTRPQRQAGSPNEPARTFLSDPASTTAGRVKAHLEAAISGNDPTENVVLAIRLVLVGIRDLAAATPADLAALRALIDATTSVVAEDVARRLPAEHVYLGLAAVSGLLRNFAMPDDEREPVGLALACIHHAALLADELDAIVRRREIEAGGDQLRRKIRLSHARHVVAGDEFPH